MAGQISTRFGVTGADAVERAFDNLAKKGEEVGRRTKAGADAAGEALGRYGAGAGKASGEIDRFDRVLQRHIERVDQDARAKRQAADSENVYAEAVRRGRLTAQDAARLSDLNTAKLNAMISAQALASRGAADHAGAMKLSAFQMQQLSFQMNDVITGLASGQRPFQILAQQGGQITQALGGAAGTMRAVGAAASALVTPIGLAVTGATVLAGGFALAMNRAADLDRQLKQLRVTMAATGAAPGLGPAQAQQQAIAFARLPGVSRDTAQAASQAALSNPLMTAGLFERALPAARDFAAVAGKEIPDAMQDLVQAMFGGFDAAVKLNSAYQFLKTSELERIRLLNEQGRVTEAAGLILDRFSAKMKGSADILQSDWTRAMSAMGNAWDGFLDSLARSGPIQGARGALLGLIKDTTAALEGDLPKLGKLALLMTNPWALIADIGARGIASAIKPGPAPDLTAQMEDVGRQIADKLDFLARLQNDKVGQLTNAAKRQFGPDYIAVIRQQVDELVTELKRLEDAGRGASAAAGQGARDTTDAELGRARTQILTAAQGTPAGEIAQARAQIEGILRAFPGVDKLKPGDSLFDPRTGDVLGPSEAAQIQQHLQRYKGIVETTRTIEQQIAFDAAQQREILRASVQDREAVTAKLAKYNEVMKATGDTAKASAAAEEAYRLVKEKQADATGRSLAAMSAEARASLSVADAYLRAGDAAGAYARELEKAKIAVLSGQDIGTSPEDFARRQLGNRAAAGIEGIAERIAALDLEAQALLRVADAEKRSSVAGEDAARREGLLTEAAKLRSLAIASGNRELLEYIDRIVPQYLQASDRVASANRAIEAVRLNRQYDPQAQLRDDLARLEKLASTGALSAKAFEAAWSDAYIRAGDKSDSWLQGATSGLLEYARQAQQVGGAVAQALVQAFGAADDAIAKLILGRKLDVRQFMSDISLDLTRAFVRQTITGPVAGFLGSLFAGGASTATAVGGRTGGLSSVDPTTGGGFSLQNLFSGGGGGGSIGRFFSTPISSLFGGGIDPTSAGGFLSGTTVGQGLGLIGGIGSGIFQLASGNPIGGAASLLGAGVSLIPGIGQIAGPVIGILGSILGGLFKSKPDIKAQGWHDYDAATGRYGGRATFAQGIGAPIAPGIGNDALKLISAFGGSVAPGKLPPSYYIWRGFDDGRMDATVTAEGSPVYKSLLDEAFANGAGNIDQAQWAARKRLWTEGGQVDLPISELSKDSDKLMQQLALLILKAGVQDGAFAGLTATSRKIIANYPDANTQGLGEALQWGKSTYDALIRTDTITAAEKAITDLKDSFQAAILKAREYGLATDALTAAQSKAINKYASDFGQNITDQLLGISDPAALQRLQLERARADALKEWDYLNEQFQAGVIDTLIERNKVQELYDQKLLQINDQKLLQINAQATADLTSLWQRLVYGDLSGVTPGATAAGTQASFQATLAQAMAGDGTALARLAGSGEEYVRASEAAYGHTERFVTARDAVVAALEHFMGDRTPSLSGGANSNLDSGELTQMRLMYEAAMERGDRLERQVSLLLARLDRMLAA